MHGMSEKKEITGMNLVFGDVRNRVIRSIIGIKVFYEYSVPNFYVDFIFVTCDQLFEISEMNLSLK